MKTYGVHYKGWIKLRKIIAMIIVALLCSSIIVETNSANAETLNLSMNDYKSSIAAGGRHTIGLKADGTVVAVGYNYDGQCNVSNWTNIVQVAAGDYHTVGLKTDGTVVAVGENDDGQCNVATWTNIVQIAAGRNYTVGLKTDGTVVTVGDNYLGQRNVSGWTNIVQVSAGVGYTVGLKADGTVAAVGYNASGQCNVSEWTDIVQITSSFAHTVGLKKDGTVVAVGDNHDGQCNISTWTDIIEVVAGSFHTIGLKSDGSVVSKGDNDEGQCNVGSWTDIVQISAYTNSTIGLKSDGTTLGVGYNYYNQCNVGSWTDIKLPNTSPEINNPSLNKQIVSAVEGYKYITISGTASDIDNGDELTICYRVDGNKGETGTQLSANIIADSTSQPFSEKVDLSTYSEGEHTLNIWVEDNNSGVSEESSISFTVDKTSPSVTADNLDYTWKNNDIIVNLDFNDPSGISNCQYELSTNAVPSGNYMNYNGQITITTESDTNYIHYKSTDSVENNVVGSFGPYKLDKTIPSSPIISQDSGITSENYSITITPGTDELSGISDIKYRLSGVTTSDWTSYTTPINLSTEGATLVGSKTVDNAGNESNIASSIFPSIVVPTINISQTIGDKLELVISDINPQEDTYYLVQCGNQYINELGQLTDIPIWMTLPDKTKLVEGLAYNQTYTFKVKARNKEGVETDFSNSASGKITVLPPTAPTLVTSASADKVNINWNQVDAFTTYQLEVDGVVIDRGTKTTYTHKELKPSRQHAYRIRAINKAGVGDWSPLKLVTTTQSVPTMPINIISIASDKSIVVTWDEDPNVVEYEIEIDGMMTLKTTSPYYMLWGLTPNTSYSYRVRGINPLGISSWSNSYSTITYHLPTPYVYVSNVEENKIDITWDEIEDASNYELEVDGVIIDDDLGQLTSYSHNNLADNTSHTYRIRAINAQGTSNWSDSLPVSTLPVKPDVTTNIKALATDHSITLYWDALIDIIGYDVELDNIVIENNMETTYVHDDLIPYSNHIYRVRARNSAIEGDWSHPIEVMTLPGEPKAPENIMISTLGTVSTIRWDEIPGTIGYEIEINGSAPINVGNNPTFVHREVELEVEQLYRIRSVNIIGKSEWSGYIINNSIKGQSTKNEELELGLTASHITDFSQYVLNVYYNKDVLSVTDLCAKTIEQELTPCTIEQEGITITAFEEGKITFTVDKDIDPGYDWTGIINNIMFEGQVSGGTTIDYTVYVIPE